MPQAATRRWRRLRVAVLWMEFILIRTETIAGRVVFFNHILVYSSIYRCFPHIINISAQTIVKELKEHPEMVIPGALAIDPFCNSTDEKKADLQLYADAVREDPVGKSRGLVSAFRASGQRRADFRRTIQDGNTDGSWKHRW